eukprot:gene12628-14825_t
MSLQLINESEIKSAIVDLRNDKTPTDWVLLTFEDNKSRKVILAGSGTGGVEAMSAHLNSSTIGFSLIRKIDKIDDSETVKYAFIQWIGDDAGTMQKAFVSIATSNIKTLFGNYHVDFQISNLSEISDDIVINKIRETSGSGSRVLDVNGQRSQSSGVSSSVRSGARTNVGASKEAVSLGNEEEIRAALREFRDDSSDVDWVLFGYEGDSTIVLTGKGSGGPSALIEQLTDETVGYGLVRVVEKIDNSNTVKFAFINWVGDNIPRMLRARLGTHSGVVKTLVQPYHVDIKCSNKSEISESIVVDTITRNSGTQSRVLADAPRSTAAPTSTTPGSYRGASTTSGSAFRGTTPSSVPTASSSVVKFDDESAVRGAIKDVRNDATATTWCLVGYQANNTTLTVIGSGSGPVEELVAHLNPNIVAYGLVREVEKFDLSNTVKFVFVNFVGDDINRMFRAKLGTHSGFVKELFAPYHVDLLATTPSEVSSEIVRTIITTNSGTSSRVRQ